MPMLPILIVVAVAYAIGSLVCLPIAYRWCKDGYDYGGQNFLYNGSAALGFAFVWPGFLYLKRRTPNPS